MDYQATSPGVESVQLNKESTMSKKKSRRRAGDRAEGNGYVDRITADCGWEEVRIHDDLPHLAGGKGLSLFNVCDLLQNDLGLTVTMEEVIEHLEESVEGVMESTEYGEIISRCEFGGWYKTWDCTEEPFMDLSGIEVLEKVPKYAGLKTHLGWKEMKEKVARDKWRGVE